VKNALVTSDYRDFSVDKVIVIIYINRRNQRLLDSFFSNL